MTAMRMLAALMLTAVCGCMGYSAALTLKRRARVLSELERALDRLEIAMLEKRLPLEKAWRETGHLFFERAADKRDSEPREAMEEVIGEFSKRGAAFDCLTEDDFTALRHLSGEIGKGGPERQRLVLTEAREEIKVLGIQAAKRAAEMNRLYISLGALGGLTLAVLLI